MTKKRPKQSWLLKRPKPEATYLKTLRFFWQGEKESALALLSDELAEGGSKAPEALYRLWIEVLAEDQSEGALRALITHLGQVSDAGLIEATRGKALMALAWYELGEREASSLIWKSISRHGHESYQQELAMLLAEDDEVRLQAAHTLMRISGDFFQLRRAALFFHGEQRPSSYKTTLRALNESFPQNPMHAEILFHKAFCLKSYTKALRWADALRSEYPQRRDYQFFQAYAAYAAGHTSLALDELNSLNRKEEGRDPDVLHLLGLSVLKSAEGRPEDIQKARYFLNRSKERYQALGYPALQLEESLMQAGLGSQAESGKYWFVKLSAKQAFDLSQRSEAGVRTLHKSMGEFVGRGDICFFVTESRAASQASTGVWRLHAVYKSSSSAEWHPTHRWKNSLELMTRLEVSIPIEIEGTGFASRHPAAAYGLLEIEASALPYIQEAIDEFTLDAGVSSEIFNTFRLARAV